MINKISSLNGEGALTAEDIKIKNLFSAYPDETQLFRQAETGAVISLLDGGVIISGNIIADEVKSFLAFVKAKNVFSGADNMLALFGESGFEPLNTVILKKPPLKASGGFSEDLSSRDIYGILSVDEFDLPPYEYFAADFCRRKNRGLLKVFAKRDLCAAITLEGEDCRLIAGIASRQKGCGGALLLAAATGTKPVLAVCRDELLPFYIKYGFEPFNKSGIRRKTN